MKPDEASRRREGNWRQAGDGALVRSGTACPPATTSAEGWAIAGRFRTNRSHRRRDDETSCLPKSPGVTPWSLWVIGCHRRGWEGGSVTPPARDALSMLVVGAGIVWKRSEGSTGTGGDVEASQVLRRHPPVTDDRLVSSQGQEGWGRGGSAASTGGDLWGAPGGPAASCCSPPAPGAQIWRARPRRRNASVWIVAPLERQCLSEGWRAGGAAAKWRTWAMVLAVGSRIAVGRWKK